MGRPYLVLSAICLVISILAPPLIQLDAICIAIFIREKKKLRNNHKKVVKKIHSFNPFG